MDSKVKTDNTEEMSMRSIKTSAPPGVTLYLSLDFCKDPNSTQQSASASLGRFHFHFPNPLYENYM